MRKAVLLAAVVGATVALSSSPGLGDTVRIKAVGQIGSFAWDPTLRRIHKGDRVVWVNRSDYDHKVVAYGGNWSKNVTISPGEKTSKRFRRKGLFRFRCTIRGHSELQADGTCTGMCGRVRVRR